MIRFPSFHHSRPSRSADLACAETLRHETSKRVLKHPPALGQSPRSFGGCSWCFRNRGSNRKSVAENFEPTAPCDCRFGHAHETKLAAQVKTISLIAEVTSSVKHLAALAMAFSATPQRPLQPNAVKASLTPAALQTTVECLMSCKHSSSGCRGYGSHVIALAWEFLHTRMSKKAECRHCIDSSSAR